MPLWPQAALLAITVPSVVATLCLGWDPCSTCPGHLPSSLASFSPFTLGCCSLPALHWQAGTSRNGTGSGTAPKGLWRATWQGMGETARGADLGRGIRPFLSFPSVTPHPSSPPPHTSPLLPFPKSTEQRTAQTSSRGFQHLHRHKLCLVLPEVCPLLAGEGGHLWPLPHLRAGGEPVPGVGGARPLHPGELRLHPGGRAQQGLAVPLPPPSSLVGWQCCRTAEQRVRGSETWVF